MSATVELFTAYRNRLVQAFPDFAVEFFPDEPETYRLNHPKGALLISYAGTRFSPPVDLDLVAQEGLVKVTITLILRQLNGRDGALVVLTRLRKALVGWRAPGAATKTRAVAEQFLGETAGLWQYTFDLECGSVLVEDADDETGITLVHATVDDGLGRHEYVRQPDGTITHDEVPL